jgi:hypothetical protein
VRPRGSRAGTRRRNSRERRARGLVVYRRQSEPWFGVLRTLRMAVRHAGTRS